MPSRLAAPLPETLYFAKGQIVTSQVQEGIQQRGSVSGRENEAITIEPMRIFGVVSKKSIPQHVSHGGGSEGQAGMSRVRLLHHVHSQEADGIHAKPIELVPLRLSRRNTRILLIQLQTSKCGTHLLVTSVAVSTCRSGSSPGRSTATSKNP